MRIRLLLLIVLAFTFAAGASRAEDFNPPGLSRDANAYRAGGP